ncbi:BatA domain-containing protein [Aporhodopirellula aestuarii]|uniref:BatA domain-containing protein n=1 Tax=Aporhodopirellula aestuarii TaxID=2950107 RepID=A0ABT0U4T3_9BACT|nr:BatA domain-containing protein [Aporhodopirellula aestuarii]MCM2371947.1 BatA domain-containing protein [Aporhodopirellula aestuarii]
MNFLQPWMLAALPLALIPIIIHLINQRRYQSTQWAAMMFLLSANRMNRGYARIRQWLILALRTLVIAALIFAIGRPIASGVLGGSVAGAFTGRGPANTIVLLDRSPSMQSSSDGTSRTKLETGVSQIAEALQTIGTERLVLIESNAATPRELDAPADLLDLPEAGPSDASADLPTMLLAALDHINANQLGQTEVWICSDLRAHDWRADDGRWTSLRDAFVEFGRRIRFRLLAFSEVSSEGISNTVNLSVRVEEAMLEVGEEESAVVLSLKIDGDAESMNDSESVSQTVPLTLSLDESRSVVDVELRGGVGELTGHRVVLPRGVTRGHGSVSIPADLNPADNDFYFTFDVPPARRTVVVTEDEEVGRVLKLAAEITPDESLKSVAEVVSPREVNGISWEDVSLLLWHAGLPDTATSDASTAKMIRAFVNRGGRVVFFPPEGGSRLSTSGELFAMRWTTWNDQPDENAIRSWRGDADLLAATMAGTSLPVGRLRVQRYAGLEGEATSLATLADGKPLLSRVATPRGGVYFCSTTPLATDSSLAADGVVLYVMIQRALSDGAKSLGNTSNLEAGVANPAAASKWQRLSGRSEALSSENAFVAGVFEQRDEGRLIAINRSEPEDAATTVSDSQVDALFQGVPFVRVDREAGSGSSLVEEVWRAFLIVMLIAMIGEAWLCLPRQRPVENAGLPGGVSA